MNLFPTDTVPETTFNNMHGTIRDIYSSDGQLYQSKEGKMGTVDKVKLNVSEFWSRKNVWESGWEPTNNWYVFSYYRILKSNFECIVLFIRSVDDQIMSAKYFCLKV